MHGDPNVVQGIIPLPNPVDCEVVKIADKCVAENLACVSTDSGMFDGVINVADQAHAFTSGDGDFFSCGELFGGQHTDVCGDKIECGTASEMTRRICVDGMFARCRRVVEKCLDGRADEWVGEERFETSQET